MQLVLVQVLSREVPRHGLAHCEASSDSEKGEVFETQGHVFTGCSQNSPDSSSFRDETPIYLNSLAFTMKKKSSEQRVPTASRLQVRCSGLLAHNRQASVEAILC